MTSESKSVSLTTVQQPFSEAQCYEVLRDKKTPMEIKHLIREVLHPFKALHLSKPYTTCPTRSVLLEQLDHWEAQTEWKPITKTCRIVLNSWQPVADEEPSSTTPSSSSSSLPLSYKSEWMEELSINGITKHRTMRLMNEMIHQNAYACLVAMKASEDPYLHTLCNHLLLQNSERNIGLMIACLIGRIHIQQRKGLDVTTVARQLKLLLKHIEPLLIQERRQGIQTLLSVEDCRAILLDLLSMPWMIEAIPKLDESSRTLVLDWLKRHGSVFEEFNLLSACLEYSNQPEEFVDKVLLAERLDTLPPHHIRLIVWVWSKLALQKPVNDILKTISPITWKQFFVKRSNWCLYLNKTSHAFECLQELFDVLMKQYSYSEIPEEKQEDPWKQTLLCCTCFALKSTNVLLSCSHILCTECMEQLDRATCPTCRAPFTSKSKLTFDLLYRRDLIQSLQSVASQRAVCPFFPGSLGCSWQGTMSTLHTHDCEVKKRIQRHIHPNRNQLPSNSSSQSSPSLQPMIHLTPLGRRLMQSPSIFTSLYQNLLFVEDDNSSSAAIFLDDVVLP